MSTQNIVILQTSQIISLTTSEIYYLTAVQLASLITSQIVSLTTSQLNNLQSYQLASLPTQDIVILQTSQIIALNPTSIPGLTPSGIIALTTSQVVSLITSQLYNLLLIQLASLSTDDIAVLTTAQINAINPIVIPGLIPPDIIVLTTSQFVSFTTLQLYNMTSIQLASLSTNNIMILTTTQLAAFNPNAISGLTSADISAFTTSQFVALTTFQIYNLTAYQMPFISTLDLPMLTTAQIIAINPNAMSGFTSNDIMILTTNQFSSLIPNQITGFILSQMQYITTYEIFNLTISQVQAINPSAIPGLTSSQIMILSNTQFLSFTTAEIYCITSLQMSYLTSYNIINLSSLQISAINPNAIVSITSYEIISLTPNQISAISPLTIPGLTTLQISYLSSEDMITMHNYQVAAFTLSQAQVILNNLTIIANPNTSQILIDSNSSYYNCDYIANVKLSYQTNNYINWKNFQTFVATPSIQPGKITNIKLTKYNNNSDNLYLYSSNSHGKNQIAIQHYTPNSANPTGSYIWNIETNTNYIYNLAITDEYIPRYVLTASLQTNNTFTIFLIQNTTTAVTYDFSGLTWSQQSLNISDIDLSKPNKKCYSQMSYNGNIMLVTYYFDNSLITTNNSSTYFTIIYNSNNVYLIDISFNSLYYYRQIVLSSDGTKLYLLSYPIQINNKYKSTLYVALVPQPTNNNLSIGNFSWSPLKEFILPNYGYCPIINVSYDGKCISVYYNESHKYCNIYMSFDYGNTWTLYKTNYNIFNLNTIDATTMSPYGLYQTYLVSNRNTNIFIGYFANNKWRFIYADDTLEYMEYYQTYNISDDFSNLILYKPNYGMIQNFPLTDSLTLNKLFTNLNYTYNFTTNTPKMNPNISLNINQLNIAFNNTILYATSTNNVVNNDIESLGAKILRIINANEPNIIYPLTLFNKYVIMINIVINNTLGNNINQYITEKQIMTPYTFTNQYINDINTINTSQVLTTIQMNFNLDNLSLEIPLLINFSNLLNNTQITKKILLKIDY